MPPPFLLAYPRYSAVAGKDEAMVKPGNFDSSMQAARLIVIATEGSPESYRADVLKAAEACPRDGCESWSGMASH